ERLVLPVAVIARWWRGLLEGPIEAIWQEEGDDRHRTFQTWLAGKATPTPNKLEEWYSDDQKFRYRADVPMPPETRTVRVLLLWARALETSWKALVTGLTPNIAPDEADPMRNKALQLVQLFRLAYQLTVAPATSDPMVADRMFREEVPDWLASRDFRSILPTADGHLPVSEDNAARLSTYFRSLVSGEPLQDIFRDAAMDAPSAPVVEPTILAERQRISACLEAGYTAWLSNSCDRAEKVEAALAHAWANPRSCRPSAPMELFGLIA
ncbi:MAG: hypothetical protein U1A07_15375, partial [Phenylobacterium sp.]|nr:hypothetical protein [Phenylobacterium sp.]